MLRNSLFLTFAIVISFVFCDSRAYGRSPKPAGQIVANFTVTSSPSCVNDTVIFANTSTGDGIIYNWDFGEGATPAIGNSAGPYQVVYSTPGPKSVTLTVSDTSNNGSTVLDTVIINPLPNVFAGIDTAICEGNTVSLGAAPDTNTGYSWSPVEGLASPLTSNTYATPDTTTTYVLTATSNGCSASASVTVTINTAPNVSFTGLSGPYCVTNPSTYALIGDPAGGTFSGPGIVNASGSFNPSAAGAGIHQITYTYGTGNCIGTSSQNVSVDAIPQPTISGLPAQTCINNAPITLVLAPAGGILSGPGAIGDTAFDPYLSGGGNVTLGYNFTDSAGCYGITSANIDVIDVAVTFSGINTNYCSNDTTLYPLTGNPSGGTYSGPGISDTSFIPNLAGVGVQQVVYSYPSQGCVFTDTQTVTISGITLNTYDTVVCFGNSITIYASGALNYSWSTGSTADSITVSPTDTVTYTVSGKDINGCPAFTSVFIKPLPAPQVSFTGLDSSYCSNDSMVTLTGIPAGGIFSGHAISGDTFNPMVAPIGGPYPIKYIYENQYGCIDSAKQGVSVVLAPTATIANLDTQYCDTKIPITFIGQPSGGYYTGPGISDSILVPYFAGVGVHTYAYRVPQPVGCAYSTTFTITVNPLPIVTLDSIAPSYCINSDTVILNGSPAGGTYSGLGVLADFFIPSSLAPGGPVEVSYTYTDSLLCSNTAYQTTAIGALPQIQLAGVPTNFCTNEGPVALNALPAGGIFSGAGVSNNQLVPDSADVGNQVLKYIYSDPAGCTDSASLNITIRVAPTAFIDNIDSSYCLNSNPIHVDVVPLGGVFTGIGVTGNVFDPNLAGAGGPYNISYIYTDIYGCSDTVTKAVIVNGVPDLYISGLDNGYCNNDSTPVVLGLQPLGGTLTGPGITDSSFTPALAGPGTAIIVYQLTNAAGCTSYLTKNVRIFDCTEGINDPSGLQTVTIYPNPTDGLINITLTGYDHANAVISLYDMQGRTLVSEKVENALNNSIHTLDLGTLAHGIYMLRVETGTSGKMEKIEVQ